MSFIQFPLVEPMPIPFVFGCELSASAGNLLKFFFSLLQKLTDAGNLSCKLTDRNMVVGC